MKAFSVRVCQQFPSGASAVLVSYTPFGVEGVIETVKRERTLHPACSTWVEYNGQRLIHVADIRKALKVR